MIEPILFGFNEETAKNNYFQKNDNTAATQIQAQARAEFLEMVRLLRDNAIRVVTVRDTASPHTPDSIFPNNWVSFHSCGRVNMVKYTIALSFTRTISSIKLNALLENAFTCRMP